jgi:glyoxylase-like metal-dependent hydrolase (beta-lactamase superfamily II)
MNFTKALTISLVLLINTCTLNAKEHDHSHDDLPKTAKDIPLNENGYNVREVADGIFMISDSIYQMLFAPTGQGVVVFDAPYSLSKKMLMAIKDVTNEPITHLVYSHAHIDHIGGSSVFGPEVIRIASQATTERLSRANDKNRLVPTITFEQAYVLKKGNLHVELTDAGNGHVPGNLNIFFPKQKVLMNVDVIYPGWVPFTNLGMAEDIQGFIDQHDKLLAIDFELFIGGHLGRPGNRQDVVIAKEYVDDLIKYAQEGLDTVDFYAVAKKVGWTNKWLLVKTYMDEVAQHCSDKMLPLWRTRLGGADVSTPGHCWLMQEHISINGI